MLLHLRQQIKEGAGEEASALPVGAGHDTDPSATSSPAATAPGASRLSANPLKARAAAWAERLVFRLWGAAMRSPVRYRRAAALARFAQRLVPRAQPARDGAQPHGGRAAARDLPPLAERSFRELWAGDDSESGP